MILFMKLFNVTLNLQGSSQFNTHPTKLYEYLPPMRIEYYYQPMKTNLFTVPWHISFEDYLPLSLFRQPECNSQGGNIMALEDYSFEWNNFQKVISHPLAKTEFNPEGGSEIFVKNLPPRVCDIDMLNFFRKAGEVFKIRIMMNENRWENRGFCYISYMDSSMAKRAVSVLSNEEFQEGIFLIIENSLNNCRIFMGGIPTNRSKDEVWHELLKMGVKNIIDVIMYRSYCERSANRGFVFLEFKTHEQAAYFRAKYNNSLKLWNSKVIVDWSVPTPEVDDTVLEKVKIVYLRNLDVTEMPRKTIELMEKFVNKNYIEKVYKFKNYAFVHLKTREAAEMLIKKLKDYFKNTPVEITWAKPSTKYTSPMYRQLKVKSLTTSRSRTSSASSSSSHLEEYFPIRSSPAFPPSPESFQERNRIDFARHRYSSTGSHDFQAESSCSPEAPYQYNNTTNTTYRDVVKRTNRGIPDDLLYTQSQSPSPFYSSPSEATSYYDFCATPPSRSSTPNHNLYQSSPRPIDYERNFSSNRELLEGLVMNQNDRDNSQEYIKEYQSMMARIYGNSERRRLYESSINTMVEELANCKFCKEN